MSPHSRVSRIDLSRHVRRLRILSWMDSALVYGSIQIILTVGIRLWVDDLTGGLAAGLLLCGAIAVACFVVGLRNIGTISSRKWTTYVPTLWLLSAAGTLLMLGGVLLQGQNASQNQDGMQLGVVGIMIVSCAFISLIAMQGLQTMPLPGIGIGLKQLARTMADDGRAASETLDFGQLKRVNVIKGVLFGLLGVAVLVGSACVKHAQKETNGYGLDLLAFFLLVRMRRYFQIDAKALLRIDRRKPILFLRSFEDEEKLSFRQMGQALFDYSLETRLSRHFMHFGPFVAIGSPGEQLPPLGAARIQMTNADWQSQVRRWMGDAQAILMYCGNTYWVNWELAMLVRRNRMHKVMLLFPPRRGWTLGSKKVIADVRNRLSCAKGALKDTAWSDAIASIEPEKTLRALLFGAEGSVVAIHCRNDKREAYHLAALVAHHVLLTQPSPSMLCLKSQSSASRWPIRGTTSIGAGRHNDVALERDAFVSSAHARIESDAGGLCLVDLNSRNGTYINERCLKGTRHRLRMGDVIRIGKSTFELERA